MESTDKYVPVCEFDDGDDFMEIPLENDGTLSTAVLSAYFPGAVGLKFRIDSRSPFRALWLRNGKFHAPRGSWSSGHKYYCVRPESSKSKLVEPDAKPESPKSEDSGNIKCTDLIVFGIPYQLSETKLKEYFQQFGKLHMVQIKRDAYGKSRGFGFIRYGDYAAQAKVLGQQHNINNRKINVKIPVSKKEYPVIPHKIFVCRLTENISGPDLNEHFSQYGVVKNVYIPKPFKAYGFVTFKDASVAQSLCFEDHIVKGVALHISKANPKTDQSRQKQVSAQQKYTSSVPTNGKLAVPLNQVAFQTRPAPRQNHHVNGGVQIWKRRHN